MVAQLAAMGFVSFNERTRNAQPYRAGLTGHPTTIDPRHDVKRTQRVCYDERLLNVLYE